MPNLIHSPIRRITSKPVMS